MQTKLILPLLSVAFSLLLVDAASAQQLKTPLLTIEPSRIVFDTTFCNTTKCATVVFRNDGDTLLEVTSIEAFKDPFSGQVDVPFTLLPGQTRQAEFCFTPTNAPSSDSQVVEYVADTRVSNSFALCLDVTANMMNELQPGMTYFDGLDSSGKILINSFIDNGQVHDEGAVFWFKESSAFLTVRSFTDNKTALISALPDTGFGTKACVYDGLSKTLNGIQTARNQKVVVLVTASTDDGTGTCGPVSRPAAISLANSIGARVFTIGMGNADAALLRDISTSTGGKYYRVEAFQDYVDAFQDIANAISQDVTQSFVLRGRGVAPIIEFTSRSANFYSVEVGQQACMPVTVRNSGDAPLEIKSVSAVKLPFFINGSLPGVIQPGEEASVELCVQPTVRGFLQDQITVTGNACAETAVALPIRAVAYNPSAPVRGPLMVLSTKDIDFDSSYCGITKCRTVSITNRGDTILYVRDVDSLVAPFSGTLIDPIQVEPNQTKNFDLCYTPPDAPRQDALDVGMRVDTREALSVALLIDVSASMANNNTTDGIPFIDAANNAAADFISNLADNPDLRDEAAVYSFEDRPNFTRLQGFTGAMSDLENALPRAAAGNESCLFDALEQTIADMGARTNRRVLIVLTDGYNLTPCGTATQQSVTDAALAANVAIYAVGLSVTDTAALAAIAGATGGLLLRTNNAIDAVRAFREISQMLATGNGYTLALQGRGVSSIIAVEPQELDFGLVRIGLENCLEVEISNNGDAPLVLEPVLNQDPQFVITNPPTAPIAPGATVPVTICFRPQMLRHQSAVYELRHNTCGGEPVLISMQGEAWDNVRVDFTGKWTAKPGNKVLIPVTIENKIPAEYQVRGYRLRLSYNKTLLYPDEDPVTLAGTMSGPLTLRTITKAFSDGDDAYLEIELTGGLVTSAAENGTLVKLGFTALLGNALSTPLTLDVEFEENNPRTEITQDAVFAIDSICYINERLLDVSARNGTFLKQNVPNPFNPATSISYRTDAPGLVTLTVYNSLGIQVRELVHAWEADGEHSVEFNAAGLESGVYFYRLTTGRQTITRKMILMK